MEVTKANFEEVFPDIVKEIEEASFLCIDGEFTGLNNGHDVNAFDTPAESYHKIRVGSMDFLFIQFGLSIFIQDFKTGRYKNKTYVFYLFPRPINRLAPDIRFLCQSSSIDFLVTNDFDFNKLFKEGIPYLNSSDESQLAEAMEVKRNYRAAQTKDSASQTIPIPKQFKPTVDSAMRKIDLVVNGKEDEVKIEKCSAFVRKLIYQSFEEKYKKIEGIILKSDKNGMFCKRGMEELMEEKDAKELAAAVGFSKVVREISAKGKLVVGHNMLLDICHLVQRFLDPLPTDYYEFKEMLHTLFPKLIDTKLICAEDSIKQHISGSTLEMLVESISKPPFHLPDIDGVEGFSYNLSDTKYHNAGYDAYITGVVFLSLIRVLDPDNKSSNVICKPIDKFMNKLFLMKAPDTCIDLVNPDPEPSRDHVFHVTFPKHWTANNIQKLFSPFGFTQLFWLSDTSAWVSLCQRDESHKVVKTLENSSKLPGGVSVLSYQRFISEKGAAISPRPNKRKHIIENLEDGKRRKSAFNDKRTWCISPKLSMVDIFILFVSIAFVLLTYGLFSLQKLKSSDLMEAVGRLAQYLKKQAVMILN